jgi:hypothetical protein
VAHFDLGLGVTYERRHRGREALTDRRSFLRRAVAAFAVGAAGTTTALVATGPAAALVVAEDPAIVVLGERIDPLLAAYRRAAEDRLEARAKAETTCPAVPEELVYEKLDLGGLHRG